MVKVGSVFIDAYEYPNQAGAEPAVGVDQQDAAALCEAAGKHLCSEAEWQTACAGAGSSRRAYPYGETLQTARCHAQDKKAAQSAIRSGSLAECVTPEGVFDLSGNVAEWTSTPLRDGAPQRIIRGGSFAQSNAQLSCEARDYYLPGLGGAKHIGLRCCY